MWSITPGVYLHTLAALRARNSRDQREFRFLFSYFEKIRPFQRSKTFHLVAECQKPREFHCTTVQTVLQPLKRLDDTQAEFTRTRLRRPGVNVPDYELYWTHRITEYYDSVQYALQHPQEINPPNPLTAIDSTCGTNNVNNNNDNNNNDNNNDVIMATASAQYQPQDSVPDEEVPIIPEDIFAYGVVDDDPANYSFSWGHNNNINKNNYLLRLLPRKSLSLLLSLSLSSISLLCPQEKE